MIEKGARSRDSLLFPGRAMEGSGIRQFEKKGKNPPTVTCSRKITSF
jgi:hypothetical protein